MSTGIGISNGLIVNGIKIAYMGDFIDNIENIYAISDWFVVVYGISTAR